MATLVANGRKWSQNLLLAHFRQYFKDWFQLCLPLLKGNNFNMKSNNSSILVRLAVSKKVQKRLLFLHVTSNPWCT